MNMSVGKIIISALSGLIFIVLMRKVKEEYALFTSLVINISLMLSALMFFKPVIEYAKELENALSSETRFIGILLKCTGIGIICAFAAELCRDCGEGSLGSKIELLGKSAMLCYCIPLMKTVFDYAFKLIS